MKSALDKYVRAYPVPHPFLETPPYVPLFRRRIIAAFTLPGHLAFIACAAALLWFYSQPTIQNTAVVTTQTPGWDCKILGSITTSDELLLSSRQLVLAVNPNCANDLVLPLFTPGDKGVPTLSYDFGGPNYLSSSAFPACPAKDPFGNPMSCLSNTLTGLGVSTIPRYEYPKTRYEYVAIVGPDPLAGFLDYAPMQPSWMTSNQGDFFMHIERNGIPASRSSRHRPLSLARGPRGVPRVRRGWNLKQAAAVRRRARRVCARGLGTGWQPGWRLSPDHGYARCASVLISTCACTHTAAHATRRLRVPVGRWWRVCRSCPRVPQTFGRKDVANACAARL